MKTPRRRKGAVFDRRSPSAMVIWLMSLRLQQILVFVGTVILIFGLFAAGIFLVAKRLTTEATLQTALLLARQVEIALAQSLTQPPPSPPPPAAPSTAPPRETQR